MEYDIRYLLHSESIRSPPLPSLLPRRVSSGLEEPSLKDVLCKLVCQMLSGTDIVSIGTLDAGRERKEEERRSKSTPEKAWRGKCDLEALTSNTSFLSILHDFPSIHKRKQGSFRKTGSIKLGT